MKAFFLVNSISGGGAERIVNNLSQGFAKMGVSTFLIVLQSETENVSSSDSLKIISLVQGKSLSGASKLLKIPRLIKRLKEVLEENKYVPEEDLFTSHLPFSNYIAWMASIQEHFAVIHNTYSKLYTRKWLYPILSRIHDHKKLVFVSKGIMEDFTIHFNSRNTTCYQIYNPFDFEFIRQHSNGETSLSQQDFIVHLGRFAPAKRHDLLLEAFSKVSDTELILVLLGDGELRREIISKINSLGIENRVRIMGWVENPFPYLRQAKASVLASDFEGLPTVLIESLILGTPVVSTNCPSGPSEILTGELEDYLTPLNAPELLAKKIEQALLSYPSIEDHMIDKFSMQNIIIEYMKLKSNKN